MKYFSFGLVSMLVSETCPKPQPGPQYLPSSFSQVLLIVPEQLLLTSEILDLDYPLKSWMASATMMGN